MRTQSITLEKMQKKIGKIEQEIQELKKSVNIAKGKKISEGAITFLASEKSLKKDWDYKGDEAWNDL